MKNGESILNHDTGFRNMKKELVRRYGKETTDRVWNQAGANWERLCLEYAHLPKAVKRHTDGNMFRNAALYLALKEEFPETALDIMAEGVMQEGTRVARLLSMILRIPGTQGLMLTVFAKMLDSCFGEDAGFESRKHCISKEEVCFDIIRCPYCQYLTEIGCPELIPFSCKVDEYVYGDLPGLEFVRTGTIGTGASSCDFCLKRRTK